MGGQSQNPHNNRGKYPRGRQNPRGNQNKNSQNNMSQKQSYKWGKIFRPNHPQNCQARDKICEKSAKWGHFAKM